MKKGMTLLLASFLSTYTFANQLDSLFFKQDLAKKQQDGQFGFSRPGMVPLHKDKRIITFFVDPVTQSGKESDLLTISCNNGVFKIHGGQTGLCEVSEKYGYFGVAKEDFINGSFGTITFS